MIDIIIATYNRPTTISNLVSDILKRNITDLNKIIVIDSSDDINGDLIGLDNVIYQHSNHKNQPYQRYLGYCLAEAEYLLYLDDDMQILDDSVFEKIESIFSDKNIVGINLKFTNKNEYINNVKRHSYKKVPSSLVNFLHWATANPKLPDGKFWFCGCRGRRMDGGYSEYFSGGAFCARKKDLYRDFNYDILELFEERIGMGEDVILAYTLSRQGLIYNLPGSYFFHNDTGNSTYTASNRDYNHRVAYSRMYLSLEFARLNRRSRVAAIALTVWHYIWRAAGLYLIALRNSGIGYDGFKGYLQGIIDSRHLVYRPSVNEYWLDEANNNFKISPKNQKIADEIK